MPNVLFDKRPSPVTEKKSTSIYRLSQLLLGCIIMVLVANRNFFHNPVYVTTTEVDSCEYFRAVFHSQAILVDCVVQW